MSNTQTGWQPIETAPKDEWVIGFWGDWSAEKVLLTNDGEDFTYHILWDGETREKMPTHWMPLPPPPSV